MQSRLLHVGRKGKGRRMDKLVESIRETRKIHIDRIVDMGVPEHILEHLSVDSLRTIVKYETEANDGPETTQTSSD